MIQPILSNKLVTKLCATFLTIIILAGVCYVTITLNVYDRYFEETTQKVNANIAQHIIDEKFKNASPFLEDGTVNTPLFGDIMHDMMAVNRGIEVYLLDTTGVVRYSVVLDHSSADKVTKLDTKPIRKFLSSLSEVYILGDDPRDRENKKIFSAAQFTVEGQTGYIYVILSGKELETIMANSWSSYFIRLGLVGSALTIFFASLLGVISVWYLTKNLRELVFHTNRFKEGDLQSRIPNANDTDLSTVATTFNSMADTIVQNIEKLQSVEVFRKELIANVSHDLRTPLAIMRGYVETLQIKNQSLSENEKNKYLNIIENSTTKLSSLVTQLFEYSKLESNQIEPQKEPFQLMELASDIHANYQVIAKEKGIKLKLNIPKSLPMVFADISLVERAIQNLMDNAIKFTEAEGEVSIGLKAMDKEILIAIQDSGPGIPEEDQALIFERYKRAQIQDRNSGTGLGLAIVRKILEIHDSTIKVISKPNHGATFQFGLKIHLT